MSGGKALVTGATGYLGVHVVAALHDAGWQVHAAARRGSRFDRLPAGTPCHTLDDAYGLEALVAATAPEAILHLAAPAPGSATREVVEGTAGLAAALAAGADRLAIPPRVVEIGSWWEWDEQGQHRPLNAYAAGKAAARLMLDQAAARGRLRLTSLVLHDLYGPGDWRPKLLPRLIAAARRGEAVAMTAGEQVLDWLHVEDAAAAILAGLAAAPPPGAPSRMFAAGGERRSLRSVVAEIASAGGALVPQWGALDYPAFQRMRPAVPAPPPPGWKAVRRLAGHLAAELRRDIDPPSAPPDRP